MVPAQEDERRKLSPPTTAPGEPAPSKAEVDGERRRILKYLNGLMVARLVAGFEQAKIAVPRDYAKLDYLIPASGVATALEALKGKVIIDRSGLSSWRTEYEKELAENPRGSAPPPKKKAKR